MVSESKKRSAWGAYRYKGERPDPKRERDTPEARRRKDTRRWCRGKVGREHETVVVQHSWYGRTSECRPVWGIGRVARRLGVCCYEREVCRMCGKVLRHGLGKDCKLLKGER